VGALASITNRHWRLTCVGSVTRDPATVDRVRAMLRANGIEERVRLAGEVDGAPLAAFYDSGDVFVLPTFYEGYGMAVANALARGLPVISTNTGAIPKLVGAESTTPAGILVPPGDRQALASALTRVIDDPAVREHYAQGARDRRDQLPTWEDQSQKMADTLVRVAGRHGDD
jgi:glycosyltransferase involved in cell wall biosynthesis